MEKEKEAAVRACDHCKKSPAAGTCMECRKGAYCGSGCCQAHHVCATETPQAVIDETIFRPFGGQQGFWSNIVQNALANTAFRRVALTEPGHFQVVLMCIRREEKDIGLERHKEAQYFHIVEGLGIGVVNGKRVELSPGVAFFVMPNAEHNIEVFATSLTPLRLITFYMPHHHAPGTVHLRKSDVPADY